MVALPVYFSWSFATGEDGNFESLARKLRPAVAPPGVGRRRVDATHPWPGVALDAGRSGRRDGRQRPGRVAADARDASPTSSGRAEAEQHWDPAVTDELVEKLNRADEQAHAADPGPPLVGPPLYGGTHARQPRIETQAPADAAQPQWFRELNLDPRHRIVAGLGTRVVQTDQEDLMVVGVEPGHRRRGGQPRAAAGPAGEARRRVAAPAPPGALHRRARSSSVTERVHAKVLDAPQRSVWATVERIEPAAVGDDGRVPAAGACRAVRVVRAPVASAA